MPFKNLTKPVKIRVTKHGINDAKAELRRTKHQIKTKSAGFLAFDPLTKQDIKRKKMFVKQQNIRLKLLKRRLKKLQK